MKYRVSVALCLVILIAGVRLLILDQTGQASPGAVDYAVSNASGKSPEDVPLYPDAREVGIDTQSPHVLRVVSYSTSASEQDVAAFYKSVLPRLGWRYVDRELDPGSPRYEWLGSANSTPWNIEMTISVSHGTTNRVILSLRRWPDVNEVLLYPNAQLLGMDETIDEYGYPERRVTYVTKAEPRKVEDYYVKVLPERGWIQSKPGDVTVGDWLFFVFSFGSPEYGKTMGTFKVETDQDPSGFTRVTLQVSGTGLKPRTPTAKQ